MMQKTGRVGWFAVLLGRARTAMWRRNRPFARLRRSAKFDPIRPISDAVVRVSLGQDQKPWQVERQVSEREQPSLTRSANLTRD